MTARFPNMIGIMRTCIKTGTTFCEVPTNKLCINVLRLFRDRGFIYGFTFVSPQKKYARLYPRVKIHFKYSDASLPTLRDLTIFKNTVSNFSHIRIKTKDQILSQHKLYLLSTTRGLILSSFSDLNSRVTLNENFHFKGKVLVELNI